MKITDKYYCQFCKCEHDHSVHDTAPDWDGRPDGPDESDIGPWAPEPLVYLSLTLAQFASLRACAKRVLLLGAAKENNNQDKWPKPLCDLRDAISVMDDALEDAQAN